MKEIPDNSVDMVLTDPPFGISNVKWDKIIDIEPMWVELKRIIKPYGIVCLFGKEPFSSKLRLSNEKMFKYDLTWVKNNPTGHLMAKGKPLTKTEIISVFSRGKIKFRKGTTDKAMPYYPQGLIKNPKPKISKVRFSDVIMKKTPKMFDGEYLEMEYTNYPTSILEFKGARKTVHPTQKPVALLEYLIKTYTLEGESVLDFTMGSGSTGVAAKNLNRRFIGIEKDDKYFEIAKNRINNLKE